MAKSSKTRKARATPGEEHQDVDAPSRRQRARLPSHRRHFSATAKPGEPSLADLPTAEELGRWLEPEELQRMRSWAQEQRRREAEGAAPAEAPNV